MDQTTQPFPHPEKDLFSQLEDRPLALAVVAPTLMLEWKQCARTSEPWAHYCLLLNAFAEALRRAPLTPHACATIDITSHLDLECALLCDVLLCLFPDGVMT